MRPDHGFRARPPRGRGRLGRATLASAWLAVLAACSLWLSAIAPAAPGTDRDVASDPPPGSPEAIRDYWTPERMREARPPTLLGPAGGAWAAGAKAGGGGSLHQRVRGVTRYPARTHGKVFFTSSDGLVDYVCSGTAVRSPSESVVWTAGHCTWEPSALSGPAPGGPVRNFAFVPGYRSRGDERPFGTWPAVRVDATDKWKQSEVVTVPGIGGDVRYDFGAARVARRNGTTLQERIGARRIAFGRARDQLYRAYGYPAEQPPQEFDGRHLFRCTSQYLGADRSLNRPRPMRIACDMTGGSSGGGWVADRRVSSVISYGYTGQPNRLYGPYQGAAARELFNGIAGG